jgi:hypothetical protein
MGILNELLKADRQQDGPIDQQITLTGGDLAALSLLAEAGARVLQRCIDCEHNSHLPVAGIPLQAADHAEALVRNQPGLRPLGRRKE